MYKYIFKIMSTTKIYKQLYTHWPKLAIITLSYFPQKHFQQKIIEAKSSLFPCQSQSFYYSLEGNGTLLQYSCQENPVDRGAW